MRVLTWSSFECEICKTAFPFKFKTQFGQKYSLVEMDLDRNKNYLMLE